MTRTILFLCSGNYYRSRFAEYLFNARAAALGLDWQATSRGLNREFHAGNVGPISGFAVRGLWDRGIPFSSHERYPLKVEAADLAAADRIIALHEGEHRPLAHTHFPEWEDRIEYWWVEDLRQAPADEALAEIDRRMERLMAELMDTQDNTPAQMGGRVAGSWGAEE